MSDMMNFPKTVDEFMEMYKIVDTDKVYTNGAELVPIFRMRQWFEHLPSAEPTAADCWGCRCPKMERLTERSGKWIVRAETFGRRTLYYYTCPLCGSTKHQRTNYCPNCGCDMRGKDE